MSSTRSRFAVLLAAGSCLAVAACGGATDASTGEGSDSEPITLTFAYFASEESWPGPVMTEWAERVEEKTSGQVTVETYPGGTLLGRDDMFDGVLEGTVDIGMSSIADVGRFPLQAGLGLPLGLTSGEVASEVTYDLVEEFQPAELDEFKVITVLASGPGYLQTSFPAKSLRDLSGKEIRGTGGGVAVLEQLGATAVGMPITEVPESLQTGVIEGYMTSIEVLEEFKLAEQVEYVTDHPLNVLTFAVLMDKDRWEQLPADVQEAIDGLSRDMAVWGGALYDERAEHAISWAQDEHGVEFVELSEAEASSWDTELEPLVDAWRDDAETAGLPAQEFLDRLEVLRDEYSK